MKCAIVFLTLVALSYSVPLSFGEGKQVTIDDEGTITILGENGKKIALTRVIGNPGPKQIEITTQDGIVKKINIDTLTNTREFNLYDPLENFDLYDVEDRSKRSSVAEADTKESGKDSKSSSKSSKSSKDKKVLTQSDVLKEVIKQYQTIADQKTYDDFITKINTLVQTGDLNESVYSVLRSLDEFKAAEQLKENAKQQQTSDKTGDKNVSPDVKYPTNYPVNYYPVNYYPANYYPTAPGYYPSQTAYPYGYGVNPAGPMTGLRDIYGQPVMSPKDFLKPANPWSTFWLGFLQQKYAAAAAAPKPTPTATPTGGY